MKAIIAIYAVGCAILLWLSLTPSAGAGWWGTLAALWGAPVSFILAGAFAEKIRNPNPFIFAVILIGGMGFNACVLLAIYWVTRGVRGSTPNHSLEPTGKEPPAAQR